MYKTTSSEYMTGLGHCAREFTSPDHRWLAIQRKPHHRGKRATAARLPAYRPSGVPLTSTEPDETSGAPPRRALSNSVHTSHTNSPDKARGTHTAHAAPPGAADTLPGQ